MLQNLRQILLKKGQITGPIPPSIFEISSLKQLDLDKNQMSGEIKVHAESAIQRLDINFNNFSGSIDFLTSFPNIMEAHLDNNNFSGKIPAALGQLKDLREYSILC
jgi:Leucine-rich repeat (LRR) protein